MTMKKKTVGLLLHSCFVLRMSENDEENARSRWSYPAKETAAKQHEEPGRNVLSNLGVKFVSTKSNSFHQNSKGVSNESVQMATDTASATSPSSLPSPQKRMQSKLGESQVWL